MWRTFNNGRMFASLAILSLFRTVALPVQVPLTTGRKSQFFIAKIDQFQNSASEGTFCRLARETRETISDSAECYAGLSVRFESSAALCNLLVQDPKITYNIITVCQVGLMRLLAWGDLMMITVSQDGQGYGGVLRWISFILNSLICWTSKRDNFIFLTPTFVTWYFCFSCKVYNMIP